MVYLRGFTPTKAPTLKAKWLKNSVNLRVWRNQEPPAIILWGMACAKGSTEQYWICLGRWNHTKNRTGKPTLLKRPPIPAKRTIRKNIKELEHTHWRTYHWNVIGRVRAWVHCHQLRRTSVQWFNHHWWTTSPTDWWDIKCRWWERSSSTDTVDSADEDESAKRSASQQKTDDETVQEDTWHEYVSAYRWNWKSKSSSSLNQRTETTSLVKIWRVRHM